MRKGADEFDELFGEGPEHIDQCLVVLARHAESHYSLAREYAAHRG